MAENEGEAKETKRCPFCSEIILESALKCKHCGEFLDREIPPARQPGPATQVRQLAVGRTTTVEERIFRGSPSQWKNFKTNVACLIAIAVGCAGVHFGYVDPPQISVPWVPKIKPEHLIWLAYAGVALILGAVLFALKAYIDIKATSYNITTQRIEIEKGWIAKELENIDMFRVTDVSLHQSVVERLIGIGTVVVISQDPILPKLVIAGIRKPRHVYDRVKREALRSDKERGVLHIDS